MMNRLHFLACALLVLAGCGQPQPPELKGVPERIISLAPDITETLYMLDLGDKLVGATTKCLWPEQARSLPRVGGFGQYNFEAIVSLKPDLVILHHKYDAERSRLEDLGIPYLETRSDNVADIMDSIRVIGKACGKAEKSEELLHAMQEKISREPKPATPPRVLITFGGDAAQLDQIYAFGTDCLHHELLERAGGINVIENKLPFSPLSKEAVIRHNPDIIIQLAPRSTPPADACKAWEDFSSVTAIRNKRIHVLTGDYTCIPGPRFPQILSDFARIIHQQEEEEEPSEPTSP